MIAVSSTVATIAASATYHIHTKYHSGGRAQMRASRSGPHTTAPAVTATIPIPESSAGIIASPKSARWPKSRPKPCMAKLAPRTKSFICTSATAAPRQALAP